MICFVAILRVIYASFILSSGTSSTSADNFEGEPETIEDNCRTPPGKIICAEPRMQNVVYGLKSSAPLFSDASMEVQCNNQFTQNVFKSGSAISTAYRPFSGKLPCDGAQVISGIEVCFEGDLKYIALECSDLEAGFTVNLDDVKESKNTPQEPGIATCPDKMSIISLKLEKDSDGNIAVYIYCAGIAKK